jgi:hypothetical protein
MSRKFKWTDEAVSILKTLWDERKMTTMEIAEILGTNKNSICGKVYRLKLRSHANHVSIPGTKIGKLVRDAVKTVAKRPPLAPQPKVVPMKQPDTPFVSLNLTLFDLEANQCKWVTEPATRTTMALYCGVPVAAHGKVYCPHHNKMAYHTREEAQVARKEHHSVALANYRQAHPEAHTETHLKAKTAA